MSFTTVKVKEGIVCVPELVDAVNDDIGIATLCEYARVDDGNQVTFTFEGAGPLSGAEDTALDALLGGFSCEDADPGVIVVRNNRILIGDDIQEFDFQGAVAASPDAGDCVIIHVGHKEVRNDTGASIPANTPVYIVGYDSTEEETLIAPADASNSAKMPAIGITESEIANGASGLVVIVGETHNSDTSMYSVGDVVYVAPGGGLTTTRPTGSGNLVQSIAQIQNVDATIGRFFVGGAFRTNDSPNIQENYVWVGDSNGVATPVLLDLDALSDVDTTSAAPSVGDQLEWNGTNWVPGNGGGSGPVGKLYELNFPEYDKAENKWLSYQGSKDMPSNETPAIVPWKSKIVGLTYTNEENSTDVDFEIYSVTWADNASPATLDFKWVIRDARVARRTTFSPDVIFEAGDKISVFANKKGSYPKQMVLTIYLEVMEDNADDVSRDWSSNVSFGGSSS